MPDKIRMRRGNIANLPTLDDGEIGFAEDAKKMFIGTTTGNQGIVSSAPTIAPWIVPTLLNGWINFGAPLDTAGYYKDDLGIVHIKGIIKSGTATINTPLLNLPAGYRPLTTQLKGTVSNDLFGYFQIAANGNLLIIVGSNASFSIECSFRAEQ